MEPKIIKLERGIRKGPFVQFQFVGKRDWYTHWHKDSIYLNDEIFDIFSSCFKSHPRFNYYGPTEFLTEDLDRLAKELRGLIEHLNFVDDVDSYNKLIEELSNYKIKYFDSQGEKLKSVFSSSEIDWEKALIALKKIAVELLKAVEIAKEQNKKLWVLGV